ncbi:MAG TPA: amidohydrolase family protein [Chitinophagaceae bacterium]|nr:amidohydrolase family protein [Chitinophagaceae bacterium]
MRRIISCLIFSVIAGTGFLQAQRVKYTLVITGANIVDVANNKIITDRLIAISGDTIMAIDDSKKRKQYDADRHIDIAGKYIMPGLWDMHVHFRGGDSLVEANKKLLPLFLYYGITTVRECGGDMTPAIMYWRKQMLNGSLDGPKIFTSGPKVDGPDATWAGSLEVTTPEQIEKALDSLQAIQADFVKLYDSKISREAYLRVIAGAAQRGMKTAGHMPYTVTLKEAVDQGLNASEHLFYVFKACSNKEDSLTKAIIESQQTDKPISLGAALPTVYNTFDPQIAAGLFQYLAQKRFSVTPTIFISKTLTEINDQDHSRDKLLRYIDPRIQATYASRLNNAKRQSVAAAAFRKEFDQRTRSLVPLMYRAGINIMAGSDCGASNSYIYPGESLHEELKLLVATGLTPAQALKTATLNGAFFLGVDDFYGSVQKGKSSDLVVFEKNPLVAIEAIDNIYMVFSNGKLYSKEKLDELLRSIKN